MQPLRKDHVDYYKDLTNRKFDNQVDIVETEIDSQAEEIVNKKINQFPKELGFDKMIKELDKRCKALIKFQSEKAQIEYKLEMEAKKVADDIEERYNRYRKLRKWETSISTMKVKEENAVDYINKKLRKVCFEEAEKFVRSKHKLYHALEKKREKCLTILHTGSHIQPTLNELSKEMATARIQLDIPNSLLALPKSK
tara:strand:- start:233 stop:823 length:591 start_codon:yes stop_codon:yes gene_type:complete